MSACFYVCVGVMTHIIQLLINECTSKYVCVCVSVGVCDAYAYASTTTCAKHMQILFEFVVFLCCGCCCCCLVVAVVVVWLSCSSLVCFWFLHYDINAFRFSSRFGLLLSLWCWPTWCKCLILANSYLRSQRCLSPRTADSRWHG